jgi:hypothetical protein
MLKPSAVAQLVGSCVGVMGARLWCLAGARHAAAGGRRLGIMPEPIVRDDLVAGCLKRLDLRDEAVYRTDRHPALRLPG